MYPPEDFLDYVNPPIGKGLAVPGPLKPLMAIPTTAGTGSETTGVSVFDVTRLHAKTGISSRRLKPTLGYLDPDNTRTMPPPVAASSGLDILSHAVESYTALPFTERPRPDRPSQRPPTKARIRSATSGRSRRSAWCPAFSCGRSTIRQTTRRARNMLLAASYAGVGFGNAGVHLPHAMSYPVAGNVRTIARPAT